MYIVNEHGILHSIPDDWALPEKTRKATDDEISTFESSGEQDTKKVKTTVNPPRLVKQPTDYAKIDSSRFVDPEKIGQKG